MGTIIESKYFKMIITFAVAFGSKGNNPGQFQFPDRIAIDPNNNVLVTDRHANCTHLFH